MTVADKSEKHAQVFRVQRPSGVLAATKTVSIDSQLDQKAGQRVVLWSEVQKAFPGAQLVQHDGHPVPFLTDDSSNRLVPLRVGYQPGVELDVIIENRSRASSITPSLSFFSSPPSPRGSISSGSGSVGSSSESRPLVIYRDLKDAAEANNGSFNKEKGIVAIKITSRTMAKQFYDLLDGEQNVQKADVVLGWDVTLDDLRKFAAAVTKAKIIDLAVDGMHFKGPGMDALNAARRFDPILGLKSNGHIQILRIHNFHYFYYRVRSASITLPAPQLRVLEIDCPIREHSESYRSALKRMLDCSPALTDLRMHGGPLSASLDIVLEKISHTPKLENLTLSSSSSHLSVNVKFSGGKVVGMEATCRWLEHLSPEEQAFLALGHLTAMKLSSNLEQKDDHPLVDTLSCNPKIALLQIPCAASRFVEVTELITSARERMLGLGSVVSLRKVEILEDTGLSDKEGHNDAITSTVVYEDDSGLPKTSIDVKMNIGSIVGPRDHFCKVFSLHGSCIKKLETDCTFSDKNAQFLDDATKKTGSELVSLSLDSTSLTRAGLESFGRIIERSRNLKELELKLDLLAKDQQKNVEFLLNHYGYKFTSLSVRAKDSSEGWSPMFRKLCPTRHVLPSLYKFRMSCASHIPSSGVEWISAMLAPPPLREPGSSETLWRSLTTVQLQHLRLEPEDWNSLIEELDVTGLEELDVSYSDFSLEEFRKLVDCIPDGIVSVMTVPLKVLNLQHSSIVECTDAEALQSLVTMVKTKKAPQLQVLGLP